MSEAASAFVEDAELLGQVGVPPELEAREDVAMGGLPVQAEGHAGARLDVLDGGEYPADVTLAGRDVSGCGYKHVVDHVLEERPAHTEGRERPGQICDRN